MPARHPMKKRILIVDDHALARAGFGGMLREGGLDIEVHEAPDADSALTSLRRHPVDVLILDLSLPGRSGLDLLRHVRVQYPELPILILSGFPERQYAVNVLRAGAKGYVSKSCTAGELVTAVSALLAGRRHVGPATAELLLTETMGANGRPLHSELSQREFDIFLKLAAGTTPSEVASQLHLSVKTVSTYRTRIMEKLDMRTNADLTRYALDQGLIQ